MTDIAPKAVVNVQSAFNSKVNWVAGLTALLSLLNEILPLLPEKYQHIVTVVITIVGGLLTIYMRTFQTTTITPSSAVKVTNVTVPVTEEEVTDALNAAQLKR